MTDGAPEGTAAAPAPVERGWGKLLIALVVFMFMPAFPTLRATLPIDDTMVLLVPALAACALVGWWAGGRVYLAVAWIAIAVLLTATENAFGGASKSFDNLARGWSLLLAGSFGLVCLLGMRRPLFTRALLALTTTLGLATIMSLLGPVSGAQASKIVADEFARRNAVTTTKINEEIAVHQKEWDEIVSRVPQAADLPSGKELSQDSEWARAVFPALLSLQSLAALALAWATYHRLARTRLGAPLKPLRDFRFNDQMVWGLIVGLTIMLLPTLTSARDMGKNLLVFFGALYAVRGLGVLTWFMAPGGLGVVVVVAFMLLGAPVLNWFAALAIMTLAVAALALGLGDTWADWRSRARSTM
ncbi:MAG: DUF2232 domain-containing protein [Gemmatimonadaceae bacterium]